MYALNSDAPTRLFSTTDSLNEVEVRIIQNDPELLVFELVNCDAAIANAFRRIMLAEVKTVAIETVAIEQNTGIMQDEVLAHRLGLIPLKVDPQDLEEDEVIKFGLAIKAAEKDVNVYSKHLRWLPMNDIQEKKFASKSPKPVHEDILITKLVKGQEIALEALCSVGIGQDHAKFSPVATATYRTLPVIKVNYREMKQADHEKLISLCPLKVFDIEDGVAVVKHPLNCTMCRECIRQDQWERKVSLKKKSDHFIFSVEGIGSIPAYDIVKRAIDVLRAKCLKIKSALAER